MKISMRGIYKSYGAERVLSNVDFSVSGGEICGLLGESGAGKSTLINILGGVLSADKGEISVDGAPIRFCGPAEAAQKGIAIVYQDPATMDDLTVCEYIFLGREITKCGVVDSLFMRSEAGRILGEIGADIDPSALMDSLREGGRQIVDICRAFLSGASVIILDETMENLPETIAERVYNMLIGFKFEGKGIVIVSKTTDDVLNVCSRFVILRDGAAAGEYAAGDAVVGRLLGDYSEAAYGGDGRPASRYPVFKFRGDYFSFAVNSGEILGLAGSGFGDVIMQIMGLRKLVSGKIYLYGKSIRISGPAEAIKSGIAFAPSNPRENSIFLDLNIMDNISMMTWRLVSKLGFINRSRQETIFEAQAETLKIKSGSRRNPIRAVPGGSQQKAVLARLLQFTPQVLILSNPTKGMQTTDREDLYRMIYSLAGSGASIMLLSDEYKEFVRLCDRVAIMQDDRITAELSGSEITERTLRGLCAKHL